MIIVKTDREIENMRRAGKKLARLLDELIPQKIEIGMSAHEIEKLALEYIESVGATPSFKGYGGFEYATCISLNEEIVHGFPLKTKIFNNGDIVSVDCGLTLNGYVADSARTYIVGDASEEVKKVVEATRKSLYKGIEQAIPGNRIGDIGNAIQQYIEPMNYGIIRDYVGHGVGRKLHEDPQIPNYGRKSTGPKIRKNMTFAIEPMISLGSYEVEVLEDGWTAVTKDRSICVHFEHSIAVTENGPEILTSL